MDGGREIATKLACRGAFLFRGGRWHVRMREGAKQTVACWHAHFRSFVERERDAILCSTHVMVDGRVWWVLYGLVLA